LSARDDDPLAAALGPLCIARDSLPS
jgi:hypothetical protein